MSTPCFGEDAVHAIRSGLQTLTPSLAITLISETRMQIYVQIALATVIIYTTLINIDKEIKYFWSCPGRLVSLIYFATRYIGIISALSNFAYTDMIHEKLIGCVSTTWLASSTAWISMTLIDYILLMRVLAIYNGDKKLTAILRVFFVLEAVARLALQLYINLTVESVVLHIDPGFSICDKKNSPSHVIYVMRWILPMVYGLVLLGLALYKAERYWRMSALITRSGLLKVMVADQGIYYVSVIACCVFRILTEQDIIDNWLALNLLSYFGSPTFLTVLGSQMLLRLKEAGDRTSTTMFTQTTKFVAAGSTSASASSDSSATEVGQLQDEKHPGILQS